MPSEEKSAGAATVKGRVAAVVVTRDRLPLLQRCLESLRNQTRALDAIYVVDVASSDGTPEFLRAAAPPIVDLRLEGNDGGAGGFHAGIGRAYADGFDWVWCMDDDGYPAPDALEQLLQAEGCEAQWRNSLVVSDRDAEYLAFAFPVNGHPGLLRTREVKERGLCVEDCCPFNGTLIHRDVIEKIGLPHPAFFIWGDEQEYKRRAMQSGTAVVTITDSIFHHPASNAMPVPIVPLRAMWKHYYHVRNNGATATRDGRLQFSRHGATILGKTYIVWLLKNMASNVIKIFIVLSAMAAAYLNHTGRPFFAPPRGDKPQGKPDPGGASAPSEAATAEVSP